MTTPMLLTMAGTSAIRQFRQTSLVMERLRKLGSRALTRAGIADPSPRTYLGDAIENRLDVPDLAGF